MIRREAFAVTTDSAGAGTVTSAAPINGLVYSVRCDGTALGGTADFKVTRTADGGTILNLTDAEGPWEYAPRQAVSTVTGGTTAWTSGFSALDHYAVNDYLTLTVAQGAASAAATVVVYYR